jgi:hypothetical protein
MNSSTSSVMPSTLVGGKRPSLEEQLQEEILKRKQRARRNAARLKAKQDAALLQAERDAALEKAELAILNASNAHAAIVYELICEARALAAPHIVPNTPAKRSWFSLF